MSIQKKLFIVLLVVVMMIMTVSVYSENDSWDCPGCGKQGNTGNYCGGCSYPAPWLETSPEPTITVVEGPTSVEIQAGQTTRVMFVAPYAGTFIFTSSGSEDTFASLYDSDTATVAEAEDDNSGIDTNFLLEKTLSEEQSVYLDVKFLDPDMEGTILLDLSEKKVSWGSWSSWCKTAQLETRKVYKYKRWHYYNTVMETWCNHYAEYTGSQYEPGSGSWEYTTTYGNPLELAGTANGHPYYEEYWFFETSYTEYRYRDLN